MTPTEQTGMLDAARAYAGRGLAVFPLKPRSKEPATAHGFKDATTDLQQVERWWSDNPAYNIGIACGKASGGLLVIDVDRDEDAGYDAADWLAAWEANHKKLPETATAVTGRGGVHYLYHTGRDIRPSANPECHVDVRCDGSYIVAPPSVHPTGTPYFWDLDPDVFGIAKANETVYALVNAVRPRKETKSGRVDAGDVIREGGRNRALFDIAASLQAQSMPDSTIKVALLDINEARCKPPLPRPEVLKIVASVCSYPKGKSGEAGGGKRESGDPKDDGGRRKCGHIDVGTKLIEEHGACFIDGAPAVRDGDAYKTGWTAVNRAIADIAYGIKSTQRREVREWLVMYAPHVQRSRYTLVGFRNGVFDMEAGALRAYEADDVITNVIPHDYDPDAYSQAVDDIMRRVSCGDPAVEANLQETLGLCLMATARFGVCPVLIGSGANGKSTFIAMLSAMLGEDNVSALQPSDIGRQFQAGMLVGKLANLGDDISNNFLDGEACAKIKKVATGDLLYTDVKGGTGFSFRPYATMVFSTNEFPKLGDSSDGMYRRLHPIPFRARFSPDDDDYNPNIVDDVTTDEAMSYVCTLALLGADRVRSQACMTPNAASRVIMADISTDNNSALLWISAERLTKADIEGRWTKEVYLEYEHWCDTYNSKPLGIKKFNRTIREKFGLEPKPDHTATGFNRRRTISAYKEA